MSSTAVSVSLTVGEPVVPPLIWAEQLLITTTLIIVLMKDPHSCDPFNGLASLLTEIPIGVVLWKMLINWPSYFFRIWIQFWVKHVRPDLRCCHVTKHSVFIKYFPYSRVAVGSDTRMEWCTFTSHHHPSSSCPLGKPSRRHFSQILSMSGRCSHQKKAPP